MDPSMETRRRRSARPMMTIDLPPHFDADAEVEEEYLTPPVWVAVNPPPIFERAQMKRTASELSGWCGDEEDQGMRQDGPDTETEDLQERRSRTASNARPKAPVRPRNERRISDSIATRTRARLLAQQAYASAFASAEEEPVPPKKIQATRGERNPVITASALTILTLARSSCNPYSPPIDPDKFANAGLPLASPFHEKKCILNEGSKMSPDEQIKKYFGASKGLKKFEKSPDTL